MACRRAYQMKAEKKTLPEQKVIVESPVVEKQVDRLLFGVDSQIQSNDLLQNNIEQFEWVVRNKIYPNFYGRNLVGKSCLTKDEILFLHKKGCKIAVIYNFERSKRTEDEGVICAEKACLRAGELGISNGTAIFLEINADENITRDFLRGYAKTLLNVGFAPGFKANTDAKYTFDREFSRGLQTDKRIFDKCLIWAIVPIIKEYDGITTTHLIHPDAWIPYTPSGITRKDIAIWQYGTKCHPIEDNTGETVTFNLDLVRNGQIITKKMF